MSQRNHATNVRGDHRAIEARRSEGRRAPPVPVRPHWKWITEQSEVVQACLEILRGTPKLYPIFGIQLYVEERNAGPEKFAALVYHDALFGDEGQNLCGNIRDGFWIGVKELLGNPAKKDFKTMEHELLVLTLLAQPEMQTAIDLFKQEETAARARAHEEKENLVAGLRNRLFGASNTAKPAVVKPSVSALTVAPIADKPKKARPVLNEIGEIFTTDLGELPHDGLTIFVGKGPQDTVAVRVKDVPEGHPMYEMGQKNIVARRDALFYSDDRETAPTERTSNNLLSYKLRSYLRSQLIAAGHTLLPPTSGAQHQNGNDAHMEGVAPGNAQSVAESATS